MVVHPATVSYRAYREQVRKTQWWAIATLLLAVAMLATFVLASTEVASLRRSNELLQAKFAALQEVSAR